jgi:hypothetical protein
VGLELGVAEEIVVVLLVEHGRALGERLLGVAFREHVEMEDVRVLLGKEIVPVLERGRIRMDARTAGCGRDLVEDGLERPVLHADEVERVEGARLALGNDERDRLAVPAHAIDREGRRVAYAKAGHDVGVASGEHRVHAQRLARGRAVDGRDLGVRVGRVEDLRAERVAELQIRDVAGRAHGLGRSVQAGHARADSVALLLVRERARHVRSPSGNRPGEIC